jgi:hypothetical protein
MCAYSLEFLHAYIYIFAWKYHVSNESIFITAGHEKEQKHCPCADAPTQGSMRKSVEARSFDATDVSRRCLGEGSGMHVIIDSSISVYIKVEILGFDFPAEY